MWLLSWWGHWFIDTGLGFSVLTPGMSLSAKVCFHFRKKKLTAVKAAGCGTVLGEDFLGSMAHTMACLVPSENLLSQCWCVKLGVQSLLLLLQSVTQEAGLGLWWEWRTCPQSPNTGPVSFPTLKAKSFPRNHPPFSFLDLEVGVLIVHWAASRTKL